jgi:hypothetical protein
MKTASTRLALVARRDAAVRYIASVGVGLFGFGFLESLSGAAEDPDDHAEIAVSREVCVFSLSAPVLKGSFKSALTASDTK